MSARSLPAERPVIQVAIFVLVSWLGEYIHNRVDLPQLTILSPENSLVALTAALLFVMWWHFPNQCLPTLLLLGWGLLHLIIGGIITILPLPFLPFYPAQTPLHYLMHALYSVAQLPLIWTMFTQLKKDR